MSRDAVTLAAEARRTAESNYRSAVLAAVDEHGVTATAKAAGVSPQAVRQLVKRATLEERNARQRLAELDTAYDRAVCEAANGYTLKDGAAITARRNGQAAKRRRRGLKPLPTLKAEALSLAETQVLKALRDGLDVDGFTVDDLLRSNGFARKTGGRGRWHSVVT